MRVSREPRPRVPGVGWGRDLRGRRGALSLSRSTAVKREFGGGRLLTPCGSERPATSPAFPRREPLSPAVAYTWLSSPREEGALKPAGWEGVALTEAMPPSDC